MTINEAITQVLSASHHGDQHFRKFLLGDDPEVVAMRKALVQLADAVMEAETVPAEYYGIGTCPMCECSDCSLVWVPGFADTIQCNDCLDEWQD